MEYNQFEHTFNGRFMGMENNTMKDGGQLCKMQMFVDGEILSFYFRPDHAAFEYYFNAQFGDEVTAVCVISKIPNSNAFKLKFVRAF